MLALNIPKYTSSADIATATIEAAVAAAKLKTPPLGSKSWDSAVLEAARKRLTALIGPMAKVIVGRAAAIASSVEELYNMFSGAADQKVV